MISGKMLQLFEVLLGIASGKTQELNPALLSTSKCLVNCHAWLPCTWFERHEPALYEALFFGWLSHLSLQNQGL